MRCPAQLRAQRSKADLAENSFNQVERFGTRARA